MYTNGWIALLLFFLLSSIVASKHLVFLASSVQKPKSCHLFQTPLSEKGWTILHEKCHFSLDMDFLVKKVIHLTSNFTWRKACLVSTGCSPGCCVFMDDLPILGWLESVAVLRAQCSVRGRIQHKCTSNLTSFDRHTFLLAPCTI